MRPGDARSTAGSSSRPPARDDADAAAYLSSPLSITAANRHPRIVHPYAYLYNHTRARARAHGIGRTLHTANYQPDGIPVAQRLQHTRSRQRSRLASRGRQSECVYNTREEKRGEERERETRRGEVGITDYNGREPLSRRSIAWAVAGRQGRSLPGRLLREKAYTAHHPRRRADAARSRVRSSEGREREAWAERESV